MKNESPTNRDESARKFRAFLSYSSKDRRIAKWVIRKIEHFVIPKEFRDRRSSDGDVLGKHLRPLFRDRDELPGGSDLGKKITQALTDSRYLLVLCSPNAARSRWVNRELREWRAMGRQKKILALILSGSPNSDDPETECFPPLLRQITEPVAGDIRNVGDGKERGIIRIIAGIAELDFEDLYRRHRRYRKRLLIFSMASSFALMGTFSGLAIVAWKQSELAAINRVAADSQTEIAKLRERESQIQEGRYWLEVAKQKEELNGSPVYPAVKLLAARASAFSELGPTIESIDQQGLSGFSEWREFHNYPPLLDAQSNAVEIEEIGKLVGHEQGKIRADLIWSTPQFRCHLDRATCVAWDPRGDRIASATEKGRVRIWDATSGENLITIQDVDRYIGDLKWEPNGKALACISWSQEILIWDVESDRMRHRFDGRAFSWAPSENSVAIAGSDGRVRILDAPDGKVLREREFDESKVEELLWSPNGKVLACITADKMAHIWRPWEPDGSTFEIQLDDSKVIAWNSSGERLAIVHRRSLEIWDVLRQKLIRSRELAKKTCKALAWGGPSQLLAVASDDETMHLFDPVDLNEIGSLQEHTSTVSGLSWHPRKNVLASASFDGTVRIWDVDQGIPFPVNEGHRLTVNEVKWSPDGKMIATASWDRTFKIWDAIGGMHLRTFEGNVDLMEWDRDGASIAVNAGGGVRFWDIEKGKLITELEPGKLDPVFYRSGLKGMGWDLGGGHFACFSNDGVVYTWGPNKPQVKTKLDGAKGVEYARWSPDRMLWAGVSNNRKLQVWDAQSGRELFSTTAHPNKINGLEWDPNGKKIATCSDDKTAKVWNAETGELLFTLEGHAQRVTDAVWNPGADKLATCSWDETVRIWDGDSDSPLAILQGHSGNLTDIDWAPDGERLASASWDGTARIWSITDSEALAAFEEIGDVYDVAWDHHGDRVAAAYSNGNIWIWDVTTGRKITGFNPRNGSGVYNLEWSQDSATLASGVLRGTVYWDPDKGNALSVTEGPQVISWHLESNRMAGSMNLNRIKIWDSETGKPLESLDGHADVISDVTWHSNGNLLASSSSDRIVVWDIDRASEIASFSPRTQNFGFALDWHPRSTMLASPQWGDVRIWNFESADEPTILKGHLYEVTGAVWSPDGATLASTSTDGTIRLWDVENEECLAVLKGHSKYVLCSEWNRTGSRLVSGGSNGRVMVWDGDPLADEAEGKIDAAIYWKSARNKDGWAEWDPEERKFDWFTPGLFGRRYQGINVLPGTLNARFERADEGENLRYFLNRRRWRLAWIWWENLNEAEKSRFAGDMFRPFYALAAENRGEAPPEWYENRVLTLWTEYEDQLAPVLPTLSPWRLREFALGVASKNSETAELKRLALDTIEAYESKTPTLDPQLSEAKLKLR